MTSPVRLQLSRQRGFRLQSVSRATNGLPAIKVDRSTNWGNPYCKRNLGAEVPGELLASLFRDHVAAGEWHMRDSIGDLRGKNLACWCALGAPCHADVLLELANAPTPSPDSARPEGDRAVDGRSPP